MRIKAYTCPSCGAPLDVNYDTRFTFCPNCGCKLHVSYEGEAAPENPDLRKFAAADTGVILASAVVPPEYTLKGALNAQWQSDAVPFTATVQAISPDHSTVLMSSSREVFEDYLNPMQKRMARSVTELTLSAGGECLSGWIEGAYDVLFVEKLTDGYVICYTYGDFYSHDTVRGSCITVENGEMIITDIAQ